LPVLGREEERCSINARIIIVSYLVGSVVASLSDFSRIYGEKGKQNVRRARSLPSSTARCITHLYFGAPTSSPASRLKNRISGYVRGRIKSYVCFISHSGLTTFSGTLNLPGITLHRGRGTRSIMEHSFAIYSRRAAF